MDITIKPKLLSGKVTAIPSKSQAHRLLICAAFSNGHTSLYCPATNQDIEATAKCLSEMGANILRTDIGYEIDPVADVPESTEINCNESGSTLRFILPVAGALGISTTIHMAGRLPQRPLSPMWEELERMGCTLTRPTATTIHISGKLRPGEYTIAGDVSSQFITGLLFAMALIDGESKLNIVGKIESRPYIDMTLQALQAFGVNAHDFKLAGCRPFQTPGILSVEGDWSNGAFFLAAKALGSNVDVTGLSATSAQGDRVCADLLKELDNNILIDASDIPDLVPILSVVAASKQGATFRNIARLRLKESDRVATVIEMLNALGGKATADENTLQVFPAKFTGCTINSSGDHRIAMSAAIAATVAGGPVKIIGANCASKSYPSFWDVYKGLGGDYE